MSDAHPKYVLLPVEATDAMALAGSKASSPLRSETQIYKAKWRAMVKQALKEMETKNA